MSALPNDLRRARKGDPAARLTMQAAHLSPAFIQLAITSRKFVVDRLGHAKEICFAGAGKFQRRTVLKIFFWRRVPTTMADALISRASVIAIAVSSITKVVVA